MTTLLKGRYEIIQTLGAGGFGETFLAIDTHLPSKRKCVIKHFKPKQQLDPATFQLVRERFEREAAVLESLSESCNQLPRLCAYFIERTCRAAGYEPPAIGTPEEFGV
jgi:serine/threonine protein kinase, bacterial